MAQLLIRDIEPAVIKRLKRRAKQHHRSLQGELKSIVEAATVLSMDEAHQLGEKWHKRLAGGTFSDSVELFTERIGSVESNCNRCKCSD